MLMNALRVTVNSCVRINGAVLGALAKMATSWKKMGGSVKVNKSFLI